MVFQVTHTHRSEMCPGINAELTRKYKEWWQAVKSNGSVKVLAGYASPLDHTFHLTVEADDFHALARALGPLNAIGSGNTSPVLPLEDVLPLE